MREVMGSKRRIGLILGARRYMATEGYATNEVTAGRYIHIYSVIDVSVMHGCVSIVEPPTIMEHIEYGTHERESATRKIPVTCNITG